MQTASSCRKRKTLPLSPSVSLSNLQPYAPSRTLSLSRFASYNSSRVPIGRSPSLIMAPLHQTKETNALAMNKKIMSILADRDNAIQERNMAMEDTKEALSARDEALKQLEEALIERDKALMERDNARAALQFWENSCNYPMVDGSYRGAKRFQHSPYSHSGVTEVNVTDAFPISSITAEDIKPRVGKQAKESRWAKVSATKHKGKKVGEDLNVEVSDNCGKKIRNKWDGVDVGFNMATFNGLTMPVPVCSCTGLPRHCYKWGKGGWQSSCCTTNISEYPLPPVPNKRHARMSGRKMSGSAFTKLLSRLAAEGHDLTVPLDLKKYWAKHGTNRYVTIK